MAEEERMKKKQATESKCKKITEFLKTVFLATLTFKAERKRSHISVFPPLVPSGH